MSPTRARADCVHGDERLIRSQCGVAGVFEQAFRFLGVPGATFDPAALEQQPRANDRIVPGESLGLVEDLVCRVGPAALQLDAGELSQHFGSARIGFLAVERRAEPRLADVEIRGIPQRSQPVLASGNHRRILPSSLPCPAHPSPHGGSPRMKKFLIGFRGLRRARVRRDRGRRR